MTIVPNKRHPKVNVSSRKVPKPNGVLFFIPRNPAIAIGAKIGKKRPNMMTKPAAISHGIASGAGLGLLLRP